MELAIRRRTGFLGFFLIGVLSLAKVPAQPSGPVESVEQVQRDVEVIVRGLYRGEVATVLRYTHPTIIRLLGGPEEARRVLTQAAAQIAKNEMKIEAFSFPQPPQFFEGGGSRFVFVPTLTILSVNGNRVESLNFQLGILEPGTRDWKYVEGSRLTSENVHTYFPGFPKDRSFPSFYRKKL